jgi:hypothetical protein
MTQAEFHARAWKVANAKARELGWIARSSNQPCRLPRQPKIPEPTSRRAMRINTVFIVGYPYANPFLRLQPFKMAGVRLRVGHTAPR